jgi:hypothetical protein
LAEAAAEATDTHAPPTAPQQQFRQVGADTEKTAPKTKKKNPLKGQASAAASMTYTPPILAPQTASRRQPQQGGANKKERASKNTKKNPLNAPVSAAASTSYVLPAPPTLIGPQPPPDAGLVRERIQELGDLVRGVHTYDTGNRQDSHIGKAALGSPRQLPTTTVGPQSLVLPTDTPFAPSQQARRPCARGAQHFSRRVGRGARFDLSDFFFDEDWRTNPRGYAASFEFMVTRKNIRGLKAIKGTLINTTGDRKGDFKAGVNPLIVNEFLKRIYHPYNGPTFSSRSKDYGDIVDWLLHLGKARRRQYRRSATSKIQCALSEGDKERVRRLREDPSLSTGLEFPTLKMAGITMGLSLIDGNAPAQPVEEDELNQSENSYYEDGDDTGGEDGN